MDMETESEWRLERVKVPSMLSQDKVIRSPRVLRDVASEVDLP